VKVEIDISEVDYGLYYRDQKCDEFEKVLQQDLRFAECEVKRVQWGDADTNPFVVLDEKEDDIVLLNTWEVNALSLPELISYIEVKQRIDTSLSDADAVLYGAFGALCLTVVTLVILTSTYGPLSGMEFLAVPVYILTPILGLISIGKYRKSILEKKRADLEATERDPSFIDLLRKLSQSSDIDESSKRRIMKRIEALERELHGVES
jgi:hypothetical protein